jgi:predicted nucleotidyltransferase
MRTRPSEPQITPEQIEQIRSWAVRTACVKAVYIFGSRFKGTARPDSDLDIAVVIQPSELKTDKQLYDANFLDWLSHLEEVLEFPEIDLLRLGAGTPKTRKAVEEAGRLIFKRNEGISS